MSILIVLLLAAAVLAMQKYYPDVFSKNILPMALAKLNRGETDIDAELFYKLVLDELALDRVEIKSGRLDYRGKRRDFPCYRAPWPKGIPYSLFISKLQTKCSEHDDMIYDAIELDDEGRLISWLMSKNKSDTISEMMLAADPGTLLGVSSLSFLLTDFAELRIKEAQDLIWLNFPFGFTLSPDQLPDKKLTKALIAGQGRCILEMPVDKQSWDVILNSHRLVKNIRNTELNQENFLAIIGFFPVLDAFYFRNEEGNEIDREIVQNIINAASLLKLTYIYNSDVATYCDSLAYSKGLKIKKFDGVLDCRGHTNEQLTDLIYSRTNELSRANKGLFMVKSGQEAIATIDSILPLLKKLNISVVPPLRNSVTIEKL